MNHQNNIDRIRIVFDSLSDLQTKVVFVGGATVSLYADRQAFETRQTDDVDVIIEVLNYSAHVQFEEQLRGKGFSPDVEAKVRCRFKIHGIKVDVMPTTDIAMGFKNDWYPDGYRNAINYSIDDNRAIKILSAPYFNATKLEAFKGRGKGDGRTSHDFEDIVYVMENRKSLWQEMKAAEGNIKAFLLTEFRKLNATPYLEEWIGSHVERISQPSTYSIIEEIKNFVA